MKILVFYRSLQQGGVQRMMVNVVNYFNSKGADVTLLLISKKGEFMPLVDKGVRVLEFASNRKLKYLSILCNELKQCDYDILFTATPTLNVLSVLARDLSGAKTKVILSERSDTKREFRMGGVSAFKLLFLLMPYAYRSADAIVAVSEGVANDLVKLLRFSRERVKVIYNPAYDKSVAISNDQIEDDWLINKQYPVIISAGRLTEQKNFELLIRAISLINKEAVKVRLIIIGEGELRSDLEKIIVELNLGQSVKLVGFKLSPVSWIKQSDLFVMSSLWEGFGNILVEALSAGTTIVSTDCPSGPSEILANGEYGFMVSLFEPKPMADAIIHALENPINPDKLKQRAEFFEKNKIMREYESLIESIL